MIDANVSLQTQSRLDPGKGEDEMGVELSEVLRHGAHPKQR
jgi:hypothetical protein